MEVAASSQKEKGLETVFERSQSYSENSGEATLADDAALAVLGYRQEFKRAFSPIEVFALGFGVIGLFPSISSVLVFALPYGGPVALVWGWAASSFFILFVALALAELGSAAPTSGGLYYWTWMFATTRWKKILAWIVGYSNSMALICGLASSEWGCAGQVMAAVSIGSRETFVPTTGQTYAVFVALLFCHGLVASLATRITAHLQGFFAVVQIFLCLVIIVALPIATPTEFRNTPSFALGGFVNLYGWPDGFAFVLSFLAPLWTIAGFDSPLHISEEASNARIAVPWATICAVSSAGILGLVINIVLSLHMGMDMEAIMMNPIGQPMATILFNSLGRNGTLAIWSFVVLAQFFAGASILIVASRQLFAFARDKAIPFSGRVSYVNEYTRTPVNAVWACAFTALVIGLVVFAGPVGSSAIFSASVACQHTAFSIPIVCRFLGCKEWKPGPFTLGRFGLPVAIVAVSWMVFATVIIAFPTAPGPNAQSMNYMVVVYGAWISLCLLYYYLPVYGGRSWFNGPQMTVDPGPTSIPPVDKDDDPVDSVDLPSDGRSART